MRPGNSGAGLGGAAGALGAVTLQCVAQLCVVCESLAKCAEYSASVVVRDFFQAVQCC